MEYEIQTTPQIKIYRDGRLSRWETIKPLIHANMVTLGSYIERSFVNSDFNPKHHNRG